MPQNDENGNHVAPTDTVPRVVYDASQEALGEVMHEAAENAREIDGLRATNAMLVEALDTYLNIPVLPDPGHEQALISAINKSQAALAKAKEDNQ